MNDFFTIVLFFGWTLVGFGCFFNSRAGSKTVKTIFFVLGGPITWLIYGLSYLRMYVDRIDKKLEKRGL